MTAALLISIKRLLLSTLTFHMAHKVLWMEQLDRMCVRTRDSFHHSLPAIKLDWE